MPLSQGKSAFVSSSKKLADRLLVHWEGRGFKRKFSMRNLGTDASAGRRRATKTRDGRFLKAIQRGKRLQRLRRAGGRIGNIHAAGVTSQALWGSTSVGFADRKLHALRVAAARALGKVHKGTSTIIRLTAKGATKSQDPARKHHADVIPTKASYNKRCSQRARGWCRQRAHGAK